MSADPRTAAQSTPPAVVIAHCSAEMYGADRQLRESVVALAEAGWRPIVFLPESGPLLDALSADGIEVTVAPFPVLRKSHLSAVGLVRLTASVPGTLLLVYRVMRTTKPAVLYVNTLTLPWWVLGGWLGGVPVLCHVHEAESEGHVVVRWVLLAPLHLTRVVVVNSQAARDVITGLLPGLANRIRLVYNGVGFQSRGRPAARGPHEARRLALIGRLSPRKGVDVAVDAVAILRKRGRDVSLDVCGSTFTGYEWFADALRKRVHEGQLAGQVTFHGYVADTRAVLLDADVVLVPSRVEPFGNVAVEGQLACRPVIASNVQGLAEIIDHGRTGLLIPKEDPDALARAIERLLDDAVLADRLAKAGREAALSRFSLERYQAEVVAAVEACAAGGATKWKAQPSVRR